MVYDLGIDVGTSYTAAAVRREDGASGIVEVVGLGPIADNIPTVLYLGPDGVPIVGDAANRRSVIDPDGAAREFKRRMGDPTPIILRSSPFSAESLMARVIEHVVERVSDRERGTPRHTVVTHPANWGPYKLELFGQALRIANLDAASTLSEPHAAAMAYTAEARVPTDATIAVYDLGGGTFDAAVLRKTASGFDLLGECTGIEHLGGVDFDEAVLFHVRQAVGDRWPSDPDDPSLPAPMLHLRRSCMEAKELLSTESDVTIPVLLPGVDTTVALSRRQFEAMIAPRIDDSLAALEAAISSAGLAPHQLTAVLLVGGSSRIPLVAQMVRERFGNLVATDVDPLYAIARGAAIMAGLRAGAAMGVAPVAGTAAPGGAAPQPPAATQTPIASGAVATAGPAFPVAPAEPVPAAPAAAVGTVAPGPGTGVGAPAGGAGAGAPVAATGAPASVHLGGPPALSSVPAGPPGAPLSPSGPGAVPVDGGVALPPPPPGQTGPVERGGPDDGGGPPSGGAPRAVPAFGPPPAKRSKARKALLPALLAVVVLGAAGAYALSRGGGDGGNGAGAGASSENTTKGSTASSATVAAKAGPASALNMTPVPGKVYLVGVDSPERDASETKTQEVDLKAYSIDTYEVTNEQYNAFIGSQDPAPPSPLTWPNGRYPGDKPTLPVRGVSFDWASAYCSSLGKRLPTEAEWEVAATGGDKRPYPWGANLADVPLPVDVYPVGTVAGNKSPLGVYDLAGNAWEWVKDPYDKRVAADQRVVRGGAAGYLRKDSVRLAVDPAGSNVLKVAGFRCAADTTDPSTQALSFVKVPAPSSPTAPSSTTLPAGVLVLDDFKDPTSGWVEKTTDKGRYGYHPNSYFHLEVKGSGSQQTALAPAVPEPGKAVRLTTSAFVDPANTDPAGSFDFGLAVRYDPDGRGLVFIVNPRKSTWAICERRADGTFNVLVSAPRAIPDTVSLEVTSKGGDVYEFRIDGSVATTRQIPGYTGTGMGLFSLSEDSPKAHIHFQSFEMQQL